jgi:SAM-dependent methyltransferase
VSAPTESPPAPGVDRRCGLCGNEGRPWHEKRGYLHFWCDPCECGFLPKSSLPNDAATLYSSEYFSGKHQCGYAGYLRDERLIDLNFDRRLAWIETIRSSGRLLEVGCALGLFLRRARERGWDVTGVEIAADCAEIAASNAGAPVLAGDLLEVDLPGRFDVIVMIDVIEHLPDPVGCITRCSELLVEGGLLVIETGDLESRWAKLLGRRWHFVDPPQHLFYFKRSSLERLLRSNGIGGPIHSQRIGRQVSLGNIAHKLLGTSAGPLMRVPGSVHLDLGDGMLIAAERS